MPADKSIKKVLILGSGALKIGEAGEFDYSGSQAIKALKEEGIETVLINPNIATIQTSEGLADKVYFLPVTPFFAAQVIRREKPQGILLAFGGQTALNCGLELDRKGVLSKNRVRVLGTPVKAIAKTEDRELFNRELQKIGVAVPKSIACRDKKSGLKAAETIGYPVIVRAAFALGGQGSGFANNSAELADLLTNAFSYSAQVLVEENLKGWKEIEYEVVRDGADNCITVCNMENFDPLGVHTGESIVIAPSQTLTNAEYQKLRDLAIKTIRHLGIVGECNIQYALSPDSEDYRVIEVNARLSRSSALASKATGYPLAHVAAKLALGYNLPELKNAITKNTTACFEPALDYIALKIPRWDLDKFRKVSHTISSQMKSVGEVMALGRSFEEVIQKGLRMLQIGLKGLVANEELQLSREKLEDAIANPTPKRIIAVAEALKRGWSTRSIQQISGIDTWFLEKIKRVVEAASALKKEPKLDRERLRELKKMGFSDDQIGEMIGAKEMEVRKLRQKLKVLPVIKQIDTTAAEYPAQTNYLYWTYHGQENDVLPAQNAAVVLGSGAYCIGSSVEFDWCGVNAVQTLSKLGYQTVMINYNPETVSTDYDSCDRLYFDELSLERVLDICDFEKPEGVIVATGGQIPNNLALKLARNRVKIFGTAAKNIDRAESRHKFAAMLDKLQIDQPAWKEFANQDSAFKFAGEVGYPVLVRPSYVLSGAAMRVALNEDDLREYLLRAARISSEAPVVITKFEQGAKEIEIDAVADRGRVLVYAIAEHVENAGVHSGDATIVLPPQKLYLETIRRIKSSMKKIAAELQITGPFNIQFLAKNNEIKVIECNLRASRSLPFASKVTGYNFIDIAVKAMLGKAEEYPRFRTLDLDFVAVKAPQFSFSRLKGADPTLGVEMASTGEVACFGQDLHEAFLKAMLSTGFRVPKRDILLSIGRDEDKADYLESVRVWQKMGYKVLATEGTWAFLRERGLPCERVYKVSERKNPNLLRALEGGKIDLVINIPKKYSHEEITDGYLIRRKTIDLNIPLVTNLQIAKLLAESLERYREEDLQIKDWRFYR